jgi:hypothetical protein
VRQFIRMRANGTSTKQMGDPMEATEKKLAAALAAVTAFIKSEEEALVMAAAAAPAKAAAVPGPVNMWGLSGRRDMMQLRNMMQFRSLK